MNDFGRRAFLGFAAAACTSPAAAPANRPNILLILLDDMGYSDIGCFGGEIRTPNIDRLAAEGVRFTHFHNTARCCPSRASLMTGLYAHSAGVGHMEADWHLPAYQGHLRRDCVTLPEVLRDSGYRTVMSGKWHLGTDPRDVPWARGFDHVYGIPQGGGVYFWPTTLKRDVVLFDRSNGRGPVVTKPDETFYSTDAFTTYSVDQIHQSVKERRPFFLYAPYVAPHFPQQAWEKDVRKYLGSYKAGWQKLREARWRRQVEMGIIDRRFRLSPADAPDWDSLTADQQTALDRQMAVYAAQMDNLDQNVGRLLRALADSGAERNTLVVFLSDNGAQRNAPLGKEQHKGALFGSRDSFGQYAMGWANLGNTPFRRFKEEEHEGGNATPLIARWPDRIRGGGRLDRQVGHIIDLVPTLLDAAGLPHETVASGPLRQQLDGISLLPHFLKAAPEEPRTLFWEHMGNRAARIGDWKLVARHAGAWELYNLRDDLTELHDLAAREPERVRELEASYNAWAQRCGVLPWPPVPNAK